MLQILSALAYSCLAIIANLLLLTVRIRKKYYIKNCDKNKSEVRNTFSTNRLRSMQETCHEVHIYISQKAGQ